MEKVFFADEAKDTSIYRSGSFQKFMERMPDAEKIDYGNMYIGNVDNGGEYGFVSYYHMPPGVTLRWVLSRPGTGAPWQALVTLYGDETNVNIAYERLTRGVTAVTEAEQAVASAQGNTQKYLDELRI